VACKGPEMGSEKVATPEKKLKKVCVLIFLFNTGCSKQKDGKHKNHVNLHTKQNNENIRHYQSSFYTI